MREIESEVYDMYPEYQIIQIVELPSNGDFNPYAVRYYGRMEYFEYDFMCKSTLKKFFADHNMDSGEYIIISDNEHSGSRYNVDAICVYRNKEQGNFLDFKRPGREWINLVNKVLEETEIIEIGLKIQTMHKVTIPKIVVEHEEKEISKNNVIEETT